jgi:hypothetical protein
LLAVKADIERECGEKLQKNEMQNDNLRSHISSLKSEIASISYASSLKCENLSSLNREITLQNNNTIKLLNEQVDICRNLTRENDLKALELQKLHQQQENQKIDFENEKERINEQLEGSKLTQKEIMEEANTLRLKCKDCSERLLDQQNEIEELKQQLVSCISNSKV